MFKIRLYNTTAMSDPLYEQRAAQAYLKAKEQDDARLAILNANRPTIIGTRHRRPKERSLLTRRMFPCFLGDTVWDYGGTLRDSSGARVPTLTYDPELHLRTAEDPDMRWMTDFLNRAHKPRNRPLQKRRLSRLEAVVFALAIAFPEIAREFDLAVIED
jgi:hypothetical protein